MTTPAYPDPRASLTFEEILEIMGRTVLDQSLTGIVMTTDSLEIVTANHAFLDLFGFPSLEGVSAQPLPELIRPDDRDRFREKALLDSSLTRQGVFTALHREGHVLQVEVHSTQIDYHGHRYRLHAFTDVSLQMEMERSLKRSEERFRVAAGLVSDYIYEWSWENPKLNWSNSIEKMLGYGPGEFPGDLFQARSFVHPDDVQKILDGAKRHIEDRAPFDLEYRLKKKEGSYALVSSRAQTVRNAEGQVVRWIGVNTDITAKRLAEDQLREAEEKFKSFVNESAYGYAEFDLEGNLTSTNEKIEELGGYKLSEHPGINFKDLLVPEDRERAINNLALVLSKPLAGPHEYRIVTGDGRTRHVEVNTLPLRKNGNIVGFQATVLDVSDRRRAVDELQRREAILQAVADVSEILLRSPTWDADIGTILERIGRSAEVDRIFIFKNRSGGDGQASMMVRAEWCSPGTTPQQENFNAHPIPYPIHPLKRLLAMLERGETVYGRLSDFEPGEQALLRMIEAVSVIVVPVFAGKEWWGGIGFNECSDERTWSPAEIDILKALAGIVGDVIQRQRSEQAIKESEYKYRLVVENVTDVIWSLDQNAKPEFTSPSIELLLGYTVEEARVLGPAGTLTPACYQRWSEFYLKTVEAIECERTGQPPPELPEVLELEMVRKDGEIIWVESPWVFRRDADGNFIGYQGVFHDITDRKRAADELRLRESLSHTVAMAAEKLLGSADWREHIQEIITRVGEVFEVSRVLLFEHRPGPEGRLLSSPVYMWEDLETTRHFPQQDYQDLDFVAMGWTDLIATLARGEIYSANLDEFPASQRKFFANLGLQSMLAVPVFVGDEPWGFFAFEDSRRPRSWSAAKIDIIKTLANTLAAAIQRQRAETAIKESERKYRLVLENLTDVIFTADLTPRLVYVSPSVTNVLGYTPDQAMALALEDVFTPRSHREWLDLFKRTLIAIAQGREAATEEEAKTGLEYQFRHRDGYAVWVEVSWIFQRDSRGQVVGFQGVIRDIGRRKAAEEAQRASERQYRLITENITDVVWIMTPDRTFSYVSPSIEALMGYTPEEFTALAPPQYHPAASLRILKAAYQTTVEQIQAYNQGGELPRDPVRVELEVVHKQGHVLWVEVSWTIIVDEQGKVIGHQGVTRDITERKRAEETVRNSEERFRVAAGLASDLIYEWEPGEIHNRWFGDVDKMFGYGPGEFPRNILRQNNLIHSDDRARVFVGMEALIKDGDPFQEEYRVMKKDGSYISISSRASVVRNADGGVVRWIGVNQDITERKRAEEALRLSEERSRAQYNAIPVPTYTWQRRNHDFELIDFNEAAVKITQGQIRDYLGIMASRLYAGQPDIIADLERCHRERSVFEREMHYKYQAVAQEKFLVVKYSFVHPDLVIAHTEDVTEKRLALEAAAEAERRLQQTLAAELTRRRSKEYSAPGEESEATLHLYPSPAMQKVLSEARIAARNDITVLLLGDSGVGKTYLAGWIHQNSRRAQGPFFDINCASLTASLIESELFGHEAGAFTGSKGKKRGLIELAHNGTLFLDEIGDMPLDLQAKLLAFLDTRKLMRVGGEVKVPVDTKIIVATNRDLVKLVREKRFREDLYYRLNVLAITVPSLMERNEDLPMLAAEILQRLAAEMGLLQPPVLSPEAIKAVSEYHWPGNVRELRNILERALLRSDDKTIIQDLHITAELKSRPDFDPSLEPNADHPPISGNHDFDQAVDNYMIALINNALAKSKTNLEAAESLGLSRHALNRYLKKFNINARKTRI